MTSSVRKTSDRAVAPGPSAELIAACRRGDRNTLERVFREHAPVLERFLARLCGPHAEPSDLLQETFTAAMAAFPRFRGEAAIGTWLHGIAVNVARQHLRRRERRAYAELDEQAHASAQPGPADDAQHRRVNARLYAHLDALDDAKRIAIVLHLIEDRSLKEVAALMGASLTATKSRVFWGRRQLLARMRRDPALAPGGGRDA